LGAFFCASTVNDNNVNSKVIVFIVLCFVPRTANQNG
jgi:hypothetical protein